MSSTPTPVRLRHGLFSSLCRCIFGGLPVAVLLLLSGTNAPVAAQDPPVQEVKLATWVEDVSRIVRPLRADSAPSIRLRGDEGGGHGGPIWEDDGPLFEAWDMDGVTDVLAERFAYVRNFSVVALEGTGRLVITAPADLEASIRAFMNRFRQMSLALTRVQITPLHLSPAAHATMRRQYPDGVADPAALATWLDAQGGDDVMVDGTVQGELRNGERVAFSQLSTRSYVRDISVQTAINAAALDPITDELETGWALTCTPWVVRDGKRVMIELGGNTGVESAEAEQHKFSGGSAVELPRLRIGDLNATLLAEPGKVYLLSQGPQPGATDVIVFAVEVTVLKKRAAELPGEHTVPGLLTKRYDVWELCVPWTNTMPRQLRVEGDRPQFQGDVVLDMNESEPMFYDDMAEVFEQLCPDWDVVGSRERYFHVVGGGYVELVNTPKAHESMQRALAALQSARPKSLATDVIAWKLTREQFNAVPGLRRGNQPVTPAAVAAAVPEADRADAQLIDTTVWHLEGQMQAAGLVESRAYIEDFNVQAQQEVTVLDPVVGVVHSGHSLALLAARGDEGGWEMSIFGSLATLTGMSEQSISKDGVSDSETLQQPHLRLALAHLRFLSLSGRMTVRPGTWSVRLAGSPDDSGSVTVLLMRTRQLGE